MDLSIVLISRNQGWNIARLIESVLRETEIDPAREIILVDSASTDNTVSVAARYPIQILRLSARQRLTAAAGRYVGYQHTSGSLVQFLDGDMELHTGWLRAGYDFLSHRADVGAVTGRVRDVLPGEQKAPLPIQPQGKGLPVLIPFCGGAGMYRCAVLDQVGQFNPYLYSDEEPDLCLRIRAAGYTVVQLGNLAVNHYSDSRESFATVIGRWRRNLYIGAGQNLRYKLHTKLFWPYLRERGFAFVPGLAILAGICSLLPWLAHGETRWFGLWLLAVVAVLAADAIRKRSLRKTLVSLVKRLLVIAGTIQGFFQDPLPPATYPCSAEWVTSVAESAECLDISQ